MSAFRQAALACVCLFVMAGVVPALHAQNRPESLFPLGGLPALEAGTSGETVPMEGAVNPKEYLVGPGDRFTISVAGPSPTRSTVTVSADGLVVLPLAGAVPVADRPLDEARADMVARLRALYGNARIEVALAAPRQFFVHVTGAVPNPGRHLVTPMARAEDALTFAFALDSSRIDTTEARLPERFLPSLRNITIRRRDGSTGAIDLLRYRRTGDLTQNPYLHDGDNLIVSSYDPRVLSVRVDGEVPQPGSYDYRPGDTVLDLLMLGGVSTQHSGGGTVRLRRAGDGSVATFELGALLRGEQPAPAVGPLDHVQIARTEEVRGFASVQGHVRFPGTFVVEQGRTTLRQLLEMAGGLLPDASLRTAYLDRGGEGGSQALADYGIRAQRDLDYFNRSYLISQTWANRRVTIDVEAVLAGRADDVVVYDGDQLVVPKTENGVLVVGHVARPGLVPFAAGRSPEQYIDIAGGRLRTALDAYVVRGGSQTMAPLRSVATIELGDVVLVSGTNPIEADNMMSTWLAQQQLALNEQIARRDQSSRRLQTVLTTVSTAVGILTTYILIRERTGN